MKLTTLAVAAAGALLLTPALAPAQTGSIRGTVFGPQGEPVPDARVAVDGVRLPATTDDAGAFRIHDVPPGGNCLLVTALGHAESSRDVFIYPDVEASVTVRLHARDAPANAQGRSDTLVRPQLDSPCGSHAPGPPLSPDPSLNAFVQQVAADMETHTWRGLLAVADPEHHRVQVTELGMSEAQYVAELLGLHDADNDIGSCDGIRWEDLERIEHVELHGLDGDGDHYTLTGRIRLTGGETLRLRAFVVRAGGAWQLTGDSG
jgi:hypothetical protein